VNAADAVRCTRCFEQHIQAFPTVRVYRGGAATTAFDDDAHAHHESYTGMRSAEAIADFAATVAQEVLTRTGQVSGADVAPGTYTLGWQPPGTDHDNDGVKDSRVLSRGCVIEGSVRMARVPGELHIVPHGAGHSLAMEHINMTHSINHLSFGTFVPSRAMYGSLSWAQRRTFARLPKDSGGKFAAASVTHPPFVSTEDHMEHEHHCKARARCVPARLCTFDVYADVYPSRRTSADCQHAVQAHRRQERAHRALRVHREFLRAPSGTYAHSPLLRVHTHTHTHTILVNDTCARVGRRTRLSL
jgi:hypothetical protein